MLGLLNPEDQVWIGMEARKFVLMDGQGLSCQALACRFTISAPATMRVIDEVSTRGVSAIDRGGSRCLRVVFAACGLCLLFLCFVRRTRLGEGGMMLMGGHAVLRLATVF
jgi:hypothetical protein